MRTTFINAPDFLTYVRTNTKGECRIYIWMKICTFLKDKKQSKLRNSINKFFGETKPKGANVSADYILEYLQD